jgi:hypothetical protein
MSSVKKAAAAAADSTIAMANAFGRDRNCFFSSGFSVAQSAPLRFLGC